MRGSPLAACLGLILLACGEAVERSTPRLVVLYATCTLNREFLGAYAGANGAHVLPSLTPNLDAFAEAGLVFERHVTEAGYSGIAFASLFSGLHADRHGVYYHPTYLAQELYLIGEAFRDAGYEPFFYSGHEMASFDLGYGQGVPKDNVFVLDQPERRRKKLTQLQAGDPLFERLLGRLAKDPDYRAFVLVDYTTTHHPYHKQERPEYYADFLASHPDLAPGLTFEELREDWALKAEYVLDWQRDCAATRARLGWDDARFERFVASNLVTYAADVALLDRLFGGTLELLRQRGLEGDSLVAFTADHGESLWREGTLFPWSHGLQLAREVHTVPWILRGPGIPRGRYEAVTRSIDVYPTLAGLAGIDLSERDLEGRDLSSPARGEEAPPRLFALSHTTSVGEFLLRNVNAYPITQDLFGDTDVERIWVRLQDGDLVLRWRNAGQNRWVAEAFDVSVDPLELENVFDPANPEHAERLAVLQAYKERLVEAFDPDGTRRPEDALQRLQDLGYVSGGD